MSSTEAVPQRRCKTCRTPYATELYCPLDGGAVVDDDPDTTTDATIGRTIDGRYLVRRLLGRGGMGAVYEADHVGLDRRVAIKFLTHEGEGADSIARFRREARAASKIVHENVVQIFDVGTTDDGDDFIVMEYVEGPDLRQALQAGPLDARRAVAIARQILRGLHAIHQAGIIHRDVKPANVLLATRGAERDIVKLTDFGIAKSMHDVAEPLTRTGKVIGTPQFMAPEQFTEDAVDRRTDLYSVGVTLYAMLAGTVPFDGKSFPKLAAMHIEDPPPSLDAIRPGLPAALVRAITCALAKSPAARFSDAQAFAAALDAIAPADLATPSTALAPASRDLAHSATVAHRAEADTPSRSATALERPIQREPAAPARKARWPWALAAVVALALGGVGIFFVRDRGPSTTPATARDAAVQIDHLASAKSAERRGDLELAIASYQAAYAADPAADLLFQIAELEERLGRRDEAKKYYRRYLEVAPKAADRDEVQKRIAAVEPPAGDAGVTPVDAAPVARAVPATPKPRCLCIPRKPPGGSLCVKTTTSLCRCRQQGVHLCPTPYVCPPEGCASGKSIVCPDAAYRDYRVRAKHDEPCTGYRDRTDTNVTGKYQCDVCLDVDKFSYRGKNGDACTGFRHETGEPSPGVMHNCGADD